MRAGCGSGCLTILLILALAAGAVWGTAGLFWAPDVPLVTSRHEDWISAQQKIFGLLKHRRPRPSPPRTVTLSERELTAVVSRQLSESPALPASDVSVRVLDHGVAELVVQVPLGALAGRFPMAPDLGWLPVRWIQRPVWTTILLRPHVEADAGAGRYLVLDVERFRIGHRRVPALLLRLLLPTSALRYFSIPLPKSVSAIALERGRLLLTVGTPSARTDAEARR